MHTKRRGNDRGSGSAADGIRLSRDTVVKDFFTAVRSLLAAFRPQRMGGRAEHLEPRWLLSSISGMVWQDVDADGIRDPGEPGHAGVAVYLDQNRNGQLDASEAAQNSGADGAYRFDNLESGFYSVGEMPPSGWQQTAPARKTNEPIRWVNLDGVLNGLAIHDEFSQMYTAMSADGRYLAFSSRASVVPYGEPIIDQVYVLDRQTLQVDHVSAGLAGDMGNDRSYAPSISPDGRYVAFQSSASNLVPDDTNGAMDVFVFDRQARTLDRVSITTAGAQANGRSFGASISANGRYVAFGSDATNLTPAGGGRSGQVYVFDRQARSVECVSLTPLGTPSNGGSGAKLTPDGRYVVFSSDADDLVPGDTNGCRDVFVFDRQTRMLDRVSIGKGGVEGNNESGGASISADGRYVAFESAATNLVSEDTNSSSDVFIFDRRMRTATRANVTFNGGQSDSGAGMASISADGRYVSFQSTEPDLPVPYQGKYQGILVYDQQTARVARVSANAAGSPANNETFGPVISGDGRHVTFWSWATNLDPATQFPSHDFDQLYMAPNPLAPATQSHETVLWPGHDASSVDLGDYGTAETRGTVFRDVNGNGVHDREDQAVAGARVYIDIDGDAECDGNEPTVYTKLDGSYAIVDLLPGAHSVRVVEPMGYRQILPAQQPQVTERVSISAGGVEALGQSLSAAVSADGRLVAFTSNAPNLVSASTNGRYNVFVFDRQSQAVECVSVDSATRQPRGGTSDGISADGRYVAFTSTSGDLVPNDVNRRADAFVFDRLEGKLEAVSVTSAGVTGNGNSAGEGISADGRYVLIVSEASNLVLDDWNPLTDFFVRDRLTGGIACVSINSAGVSANGDNRGAGSISADGRYVAFGSYAPNLVSGDTNNYADIFVFDRAMTRTERVSISSTGVQANDWSQKPSISADGRYVAFSSYASDLVPGDANECADVFVFDRRRHAIERVSVSSADGEANGDSSAPSISADGRYVAFESSATNLVDGDTNNQVDIFVFDRRTGRTTRVNVSSADEQANGGSRAPSISADGHCVAFESDASNLVGADANAARDIFIVPSSRMTRPAARIVTLGMGQVAEGNDILFEQSAMISGRIWNDRNCDGSIDPYEYAHESGIGQVAVRLYRDNGDGVLETDGSDQALLEQSTASDGSFSFDDLQPGGYWVLVDQSSAALEGFHPSGSTAARFVTVSEHEHAAVGAFGYYKPIIVTSLGDSDDPNPLSTNLTLRQALAIAKAAPGYDVIDFAPGLSGTIRLAVLHGWLAIDSDVMIRGPGADRLEIKASGHRVLYVVGVQASLSGLSVRGGLADNGAGILVGGPAFLHLANMVIDSNQATGWGGGIWVGTGATLAVTDSTISGNTASDGGGIASSGVVTVTRCAIIRNTATSGAINRGRGGGVYAFGLSLTIQDSTIGENAAQSDGGGICANAVSASLTNVTIAGNFADSGGSSSGGGGGLWCSHGSVTVHNTIVAGNLSGQEAAKPDDIYGPLEPASSYNLIGTGKNSGLAPGQNGNRIGTDTALLDAKLMPLGDYGGLTQTYALRVDSPAIDVGSNDRVVAAGLDTDQRGMVRLVDHLAGGNAIVDIGAYETPPAIVVNTATDELANGDGKLSLREALAQAEQSPGLDVIQFAPDVTPGGAGTISLMLGMILVVDSPVDIQGPREAKLSIDGVGGTGVFGVNAGSSCWLSNLTITGGKAYQGGGILNSGTLSVDHVLLTGNRAFTDGGAIWSSGTLSVLDCTLTSNVADSSGGGIYVAAGAARIVNNTVYGNRARIVGQEQGQGAGICVMSGTSVTLQNTVVAGNAVSWPIAVEDDVAGPFTAESGFDFIGVIDGSTGLRDCDGMQYGKAAEPKDPLLELLADNGGPTWTHKPRVKSPLIDQGSDALAQAAGLRSDQRYFNRSRDGNGDGQSRVDIGAYELQDPLNQLPELTTIKSLTGAKERTPLIIRYEELLALSDARDLDGDEIRFRIESIESGELKLDAMLLDPQDLENTPLDQRPLLYKGQKLVWTPPAIDFGTDTTRSTNAFTVRAWDGKEPSAEAAVVPITVAAAAKSVNYAVLFSGGVSPQANLSIYYENLKRLYQALVPHYLDPANVYILSADGTDPGPDQPGGVSSDMTFGLGPEERPQHVRPATRTDLRSTLVDSLSRLADSNDHLFLWTFDHGGVLGDAKGSEEDLQGWGSDQDIKDTELKVWLQGLKPTDAPSDYGVDQDYDGIHAGYTTYVFGQCYAGGMLDDLAMGPSVFGAAATNHYEVSLEDYFVRAFTEAIENGYNGTRSAFSYAFQHDGHARDGGRNGGQPGWGIEHPWSDGGDFQIFSPLRVNAPPEPEQVLPLKLQPDQRELQITYDMLMAASDGQDPSGQAIVFQIVSEDIGQLYRDGHRIDLTDPLQITLGYGQSITWKRPANVVSGTVNAFRLDLLGSDGAPTGDPRVVPIRIGSPSQGPRAADDTHRVQQNGTDHAIDVLANDAGTELKVIRLGVASHGQLMLDSTDNRIYYTPASDFLGIDIFSYVVSDGHNTDMATVSVMVVCYDPDLPLPEYVRYGATELPPPSGWAGLPQQWSWDYLQALPSWTESESLDISDDGIVAVGTWRSGDVVPSGSDDPQRDLHYVGSTYAGYWWQAGGSPPYWLEGSTNTFMLLLPTEFQHDSMEKDESGNRISHDIYHGIQARSMMNPGAMPAIRYWDPDNAHEPGWRKSGGIWFDLGSGDPVWQELPDGIYPVSVSSTPLSSVSLRAAGWAAFASPEYLVVVNNTDWKGLRPTRAELWKVGRSGVARVKVLPQWPDGSQTYANAMNNVGHVVGWAEYRSHDYHAFLYDGDQLRDLGVLSGYEESEALAVNVLDQVVGFSSDNIASRQLESPIGEGFLWDKGNMIPLGTLPINAATNWSIPYDINDLGVVVGASNGHAFVWLDGAMYDLNALTADALPPDVVLTAATGINNLNQIVATGRTPDGLMRSYYLDVRSFGISIGGDRRRAFGASAQLAELEVRDSAVLTLAQNGSRYLEVGKLVIDPQATIDLFDNDMILTGTAGTRAAVLSQAVNWIRSARNGGTWTGQGITSSVARAYPGGFTGLACIINDKMDGTGALFATYPTGNGLPVGANDVLVKYTWNGDANLDGLLNADDYFLADSGYITQKGGWYNGDFNYDGIVNADDYFLIDSAYIAQSGPLAADEPEISSSTDWLSVKQPAKKVDPDGVLAQLFSTEPVL